MALNPDILQQLVSISYLPAINAAFGSAGMNSARKALKALNIIYKYLAPELITGLLIVVEPVEGFQNLTEILGEPDRRISPEYLGQEYDTNLRNRTLIIQEDQNQLHIWVQTIDIYELSHQAITYTYHEREEFFVVRGEKKIILNPDSVYYSVFSIPTFSHLEEALEDYKRSKIRTSGCKIFSNAWHNGDTGDRLFFCAAPESIMRDSLTQHLKTVLKAAEVRPEQVVDESHPVDIKVTWMMSNRIALIEIKWLGKSINDQNRTINYTDRRARDGATQLAQYLDANRTQVPTHQTVGYLVVIDARRRGLNPSSTSIDCIAGNYYSDREIEFNPEYQLLRRDFKKPVRMFAEPKCR